MTPVNTRAILWAVEGERPATRNNKERIKTMTNENMKELAARCAVIANNANAAAFDVRGRDGAFETMWLPVGCA